MDISFHDFTAAPALTDTLKATLPQRDRQANAPAPAAAGSPEGAASHTSADMPRTAKRRRGEVDAARSGAISNLTIGSGAENIAPADASVTRGARGEG
jgi:hypothetical protein